jgi:hypothetical protein
MSRWAKLKSVLLNKDKVDDKDKAENVHYKVVQLDQGIQVKVGNQYRI